MHRCGRDEHHDQSSQCALEDLHREQFESVGLPYRQSEQLETEVDVKLNFQRIDCTIPSRRICTEIDLRLCRKKTFFFRSGEGEGEKKRAVENYFLQIFFS